MSIITRFAGNFNAADYAYGVAGAALPGPLVVGSGNTSTGAQTLLLQFGYTTLQSGETLLPLATTAPITVGSGANAETVTPSAVSQPTPGVYDTATVTATFSNLHGIGDLISSATFGLQEAINACKTYGGGSVIVDARWKSLGGTSGMIAAATIPSGVVIVDNRSGNTGGTYLTASGTLSNTAVKALNSAPSLLLAAQGAGTLIVPVFCVLENLNGGVAYANGGAISLAYGSAGTVVASSTIAATFLTSPTASEIGILRSVSADVGLSSATLNTGLYIAAASADFITGTGTMKWSLTYQVVTGL